MIKIKLATAADTTVLALLGRLTWAESHGHYVENKNNLLKYLDSNFSVSKTKQEINNPKNLFYIMYVDDLPVGYAKLILNAKNENVASQNNCRLERIFIQNEFIPLKIGKQLLTFVETEAKALQLDTMWLTVYIKNNRAIRFYEKNEFKNVGALNFIVNGAAYENIVFSKNIKKINEFV
ncbi:GNAT family N-acetyltransferase [Aureibaculum sp. 2210JD6-5]|uniref:GNAT family N-acetyltransferase n=1 Tax=Aureibaculum sp. 2210JD6-5 TaxID=3103957 RepID=UPI002AAD9ECC|nr:GNAT family N-acetyltransferase [Aureibaculum sp. 2210JD6-5]MDY7393845.1 GNAT family N-acetyltransferase [Aureibaculum sp. 2210JD6-5]